ncbi:hypothetical protein [Vibrio cholerae]|uniref:hypothetical protein n=1 Tax=Vibrio cholerae TaxID=666 RepID=UPI0006E5BAE4|nr:hypothetical protein [Vibrio cholerae]KQA38677.1 hypothetical protein XV74_12305 [Vibrio cholerae]KQA42629.1 hypothetical protein XV75_15165 [Vibrio cholerae]KQA57777.1 hypothetical protein XV79_07585 [Vibrio cholerae]KQA73011.1 hypothetical protein XV84_13690 [Vibrio cholerae]KQA78306.1 hypothetical protein XV85_09910 [Vibrio cholerae]
MLRSMTNTFIAIIVFITLFLLGSLPHANAASCPIGDTPSLKWPLGTSYIASACVNGCRAVEGSSGQNTWTCNTSAGYCTGYFTTTGDSCSGSDNTNGSCDANGNCTGSGGTGGGTNGNGLVTVPMLPYSVIQGTDLSKAFEHTVKSLNNQNEYVRREIESLKTQSINKLQGIYNSVTANTSAVKASQQHITDTRNESVRQTQEFYKANDKLQQIIIKSADMITSMATTRSFINSNADNIVRAVRDVQQTISPLEFGLFDINENTRLVNQNLAALSEGLFYTMNDNTNKIVSAINANGGGSGGDTDLSGVQSGIDSIKTGIDNLNGLLSGNGLSKPGIGSGVDFGELPLYGEDAITKLNTEITDLQKEYSEKTKEFKKLFSFDITKLESGQYKDHSLTFKFANGATTKFTSGVFPALVDNAALISSVILFLAAFAGIKTIMGERE